MAYTKQTWTDSPSTSSPINATRLNHMEEGIYQASMGGGVSYSTDEFDTGQKWIDGNTIYGKTYLIPDAVTTGYVIDDDWDSTYNFIRSEATCLYSDGGSNIFTLDMPVSASSMIARVQVLASTNKPVIYITSNNTRFTNYKITLFYTKQASS